VKNKGIVKGWLVGVVLCGIGGFISGYNGHNTDISALASISGALVSLVFAIWAMVRLWKTEAVVEMADHYSERKAKASSAAPFAVWKNDVIAKDVSNKYLSSDDLNAKYELYLKSFHVPPNKEQQNKKLKTAEAAQAKVKQIESESRPKFLSTEQRLERLKKLRDEGLIDEDAAKAKIKELLSEL
jgi:hypothetical protein